MEDEALIGMNESMQLKKYGYNVIHVLSGQEAIQILENHNQINLVLMDIDLGSELDGTQTAQIILKKHSLPLIFLSSHIEPEIVEKTENITSYGYVVKNSSITVLDASIKMAFRLHEAYSVLEKQKLEIETRKKELQYFEKRYRRLFESAKDGILILNAETGIIVDVNPFLIQMLGYSKEQFLDKNLWDIGAFKNIDISKQLFKELQDKEYVRYENLPLETKNGILVHVEFVSNVYLVDSEKVIQCNIRDITVRKLYEKSLTKHIDENEALLKEIQHRTKNSFNMITSLIYLRGNACDSIDTKNTLKELSQRVTSISDLYTLLYETDSYYNVQLQSYCNKVINSMHQISNKVLIDKDIEEITVSTKDAATFGMIIVELLSNAFKYAFPDSQKGTVHIELKTINSKIVLTIQDNGIGFQKDFNISETKTMGLHLVNLMVKQLDGSIEIVNKNGTKVMITCPL